MTIDFALALTERVDAPAGPDPLSDAVGASAHKGLR
jgi:hypothetical protein